MIALERRPDEQHAVLAAGNIEAGNGGRTGTASAGRRACLSIEGLHLRRVRERNRHRAEKRRCADRCRIFHDHTPAAQRRRAHAIHPLPNCFHDHLVLRIAPPAAALCPIPIRIRSTIIGWRKACVIRYRMNEGRLISGTAYTVGFQAILTALSLVTGSFFHRGKSTVFTGKNARFRAALRQWMDVFTSFDRVRLSLHGYMVETVIEPFISTKS